MGDTERPYRVVVTGDKLAPEAMKILTEKCRVVFTGPYPQVSVLAQRLSEEKAHALILRTGKAPAEVVKASPDLKVIAKGNEICNRYCLDTISMGIPFSDDHVEGDGLRGAAG